MAAQLNFVVKMLLNLNIKSCIQDVKYIKNIKGIEDNNNIYEIL